MSAHDPLCLYVGDGPCRSCFRLETARAEARADERAKWVALVTDGIEAFRLTKEYVNLPDEHGFVLLPDIEGWSHFDWIEHARAALQDGTP